MAKKVIFWDFHGTLANNEWMFSKALYSVIRDTEPDLSIAAFQRLPIYGFPWNDPKKEYLHWIPAEEWWKNAQVIFTGVYKRLGIPEEKALEYARQVRRELTKPERYELYEDTVEMLEYFQARGWENRILSNHIPELPDIVAYLGLDRYVVDCISSGNIGYEKPNPAIYRIALERAGFPEEVWMVGDSLEADVKGPEKAGIRGILVHTDKTKEVTYYSRDLRGVRDLIDRTEA